MILSGFWGFIEVVFARRCWWGQYPKIWYMLSRMPDFLSFLISLIISAAVVFIILILIIPPAIEVWKRIKFQDYYRAEGVKQLLQKVEEHSGVKNPEEKSEKFSKYDGYEAFLNTDTSILIVYILVISVLFLKIAQPVLAGFFDLMWDWFEKVFGFILGDILAGVICLAIGGAVIFGLWRLWDNAIDWAYKQVNYHDKKD